MMLIELKPLDGKRAWRIVVFCDYCKKAITDVDGWFTWEEPYVLAETSHFLSITHLHDACINDHVFMASQQKTDVRWVGCQIKDLNNEEGIPVYQFNPESCSQPTIKVSDIDEWLAKMYLDIAREQETVYLNDWRVISDQS